VCGSSERTENLRVRVWLHHVDVGSPAKFLIAADGARKLLPLRCQPRQLSLEFGAF
jgi:hypothetical protein